MMRYDVLSYGATGPDGITVLDPVQAELLFLARLRPGQLNFRHFGYPALASFGPLPVGVGSAFGGVKRRSQILGELHSLLGIPCAQEDVAYLSLLEESVGGAIIALLYSEEGAYSTYTRRILECSAPLGFGWAVAWKERARHKVNEATLLGLHGTLHALATRLEGDSFGVSRGEAARVEKLTRLDARAFAYLSVLFSIPCDPASHLRNLIGEFPALALFCDRMDALLEVWPDRRTFLAGVAKEARLPEAAAFCGEAPTQEPWWVWWGWSWGDWKPPERRVRKQPPSWSLSTFVVAGLGSISIAMYKGWGGVPWKKLVKHCEQFLKISR